MTDLQFPITNEEAKSMGYTLGMMNAANCALRMLWQLVEREARARRAQRAWRASR